MYYLKGKGLLAGLYLQKSMAEAYYIEYNYFIGDFDFVKKYPTKYEADVFCRVEVLSKDTINGEHFMDAMIEYDLYSKEELIPYLFDAFENIILPPVHYGKKYILDNFGKYYIAIYGKEEETLKKLKE